MLLSVHRPNPKHLVPLAKRREFLLSNGERVIVANPDPKKSWANEVFFSANKTAKVVRELTGKDKSAPFRPKSE